MTGSTLIVDELDLQLLWHFFLVCLGSVIKGWEQGIPTMLKGERAKLFIHPDYGYGANGSGQIPGDSPLIFEVCREHYCLKFAIM